ncbi:ATP-binding protein, partial [Acinetobacter baumannii]|uniref:ATP-binding protein n=1 Tax=Acinetobacter baumannii TaxID=470 RepID=UPI000B16317A
MRDIAGERKQLRLHGMAGAWADLIEQGAGSGSQEAGWLIEHLLQAEATDRAMRSINH